MWRSAAATCLIHTPFSSRPHEAGMWRLEDVPTDSCPFVRARCEISFDTWEGDRYLGTVAASFATDNAGYVLLSGVSALRRSVAADVLGRPQRGRWRRGVR